MCLPDGYLARIPHGASNRWLSWRRIPLYSSYPKLTWNYRPNRHKPRLFGISLISFSSFNSIPRFSRNRICLINLNEQKSRFFTSNNWLRTKYIPDANIIKRSHRFWAQRIWPKYRLVIGPILGWGWYTNRWYNTDCGFTSVEPCR